MCVCVEGGRGLISKDQLEGEVPGNANCSKIPYPVTVFWLVPEANPEKSHLPIPQCNAEKKRRILRSNCSPLYPSLSFLKRDNKAPLNKK